MLEVYSRNVSALANAPIALNNVALLKGNSTQLQGVSTIQLNKCGVYEISVSAVATAETAGQISIQLEKDDVLQPHGAVLYGVSEIPDSRRIRRGEDLRLCGSAHPDRGHDVNHHRGSGEGAV